MLRRRRQVQLPPLIALIWSPGHDAGRGSRQRMTVSLSLVDGVGSLGRPVSWSSQDRIQERRELQGEREEILESCRSSFLSLQLSDD